MFLCKHTDMQMISYMHILWRTCVLHGCSDSVLHSQVYTCALQKSMKDILHKTLTHATKLQFNGNLDSSKKPRDQCWTFSFSHLGILHSLEV